MAKKVCIDNRQLDRWKVPDSKRKQMTYGYAVRLRSAHELTAAKELLQHGVFPDWVTIFHVEGSKALGFLGTFAELEGDRLIQRALKLVNARANQIKAYGRKKHEPTPSIRFFLANH